MGIYKNFTLKLKCDSFTIECNKDEYVFKGNSFVDAKKKAIAKGWIVKSTKCICPYCVNLQ